MQEDRRIAEFRFYEELKRTHQHVLANHDQHGSDICYLFVTFASFANEKRTCGDSP